VVGTFVDSALDPGAVVGDRHDVARLHAVHRALVLDLVVDAE
jgi:hypothetical protein